MIVNPEVMDLSELKGCYEMIADEMLPLGDVQLQLAARKQKLLHTHYIAQEDSLHVRQLAKLLHPVNGPVQICPVPIHHQVDPFS